MNPVKVGILGATGMVGQRFMALLENHPYFRLTEVVASERSAGKKYRDAATWVLDSPMPAMVKDLDVKLALDDLDVDLVFSAIPAGKAGKIEEELANRGTHVFTNARDHRWDPNVPLLLPDVNPDHLALVDRQARDGKIVTNGNCSTITLVSALKPLHDAFGVKRVIASTYQAISGAGYPGLSAIDMLGNIVPYIGGEEEKIAKETTRFLGTLGPDGIALADIPVSATAVRVNVQEGHTVSASVELGRDVTPEEAVAVLREYRSVPQERQLPSAPPAPVLIAEDDTRPQPRRDALVNRGMSATVGRVRPDPILGLKFVVTASNTIRGAAGSNVLGAELFVSEGRL